MMRSPTTKRRLVRLAVLMLAPMVLFGCPGDGGESAGGNVPISTLSDEARALYLEGRDLQERLRAPEARQRFERALELDPEFALAWLGMANTSASAAEFFDALTQAIARTDSVSRAELHLIEAASAAARGESEAQGYHLDEVVKLHPGDARAHQGLAAFYFGRQEYEAAMPHYRRATEIDPSFSQPFNQMGYVHRFQGRYDEAAEAFERYIELNPDDPNPYDSYAEMLMEQGRFEDSIGKYRRALEQDAGFVASYIGIGCNQILLGQGDAARETFRAMFDIAVNDGQRRQALVRVASTYLHEDDYDRGLESYRKVLAISEANGDLLTMANDHNQLGNILLEAGRGDEARAEIEQAVPLADRAGVPEETREGVRRNRLYWLARVDLLEGDLARAEEQAREYERQVVLKQIPFELRRRHELFARIALARGEAETALAALAQANQQDPRVLWLTARAHAAAGDAEQARAWTERTVHYNGLNPNYAFVRGPARAMLADG